MSRNRSSELVLSLRIRRVPDIGNTPENALKPDNIAD